MLGPRRRFLHWLGGASLAGVAASPAQLFAGPHLPPWPTGQSDNSSAGNAEHPLPVAETWDMSWTDRVTGRFRAVFDCPELSNGAAITRAVAWPDMYKEVYGTERRELSPVLVIRHNAIDLLMNDAYWERFQLGKQHKMRDGEGKKWAMKNPVSAASRPDNERARKYTLESFIASGGIVLGCGWAFRFVSSRIQEAEKIEAAAARAKATEYLIPGVIMQPNGIFACLRAQEAGCHYVLAG
jgi:hypothetical protein